MKKKHALLIGCVALLVAALLMAWFVNKDRSSSTASDKASTASDKVSTTSGNGSADGSMEVITGNFEDEVVVENNKVTSAPVSQEDIYGENDTQWATFDYED